MATLCSLFSGSSGNCVYLEQGGTAILIDAGMSAKSITSALQERGLAMEKVGAVFITHTHCDHIKGVHTLLNKYKMPLFATGPTLSAMATGGLFPTGFEPTVIEGRVTCGDFEIVATPTPHDAEGSCCYRITLKNGESVAVCTDLGYVTDAVKETLLGCRAVLLESNHDVTMLQKGPYPPQLKRRISGKFGHLSNTASASQLPDLVAAGTTQVVLAHLSEMNNTPEIARRAAEASLLAAGMKAEEDCRLSVAAPEGNGLIVF